MATCGECWFWIEGYCYRRLGVIEESEKQACGEFLDRKEREESSNG